MKAKAIRLPDPLLRGVEIVQRREAIDAATATRKLLKMGLERYVAQLYREGEITLREAASLLELPLREAMELLAQLGITGNVTASQNLDAMGGSTLLSSAEESWERNKEGYRYLAER